MTSTQKSFRISEMDFEAYNDSIYFNVLHINGFISLIASALAIYFIIYKSPSTIGKYKWYLLNITICSLLFDLQMTVLWMPQPLYPAMAMCSKGFMESFGWYWGGFIGFCIFVQLLGMCMMTIICAFIYRWAVLTQREHLIDSKRAIFLMGLMQLFYETPTIIMYHISAINHDADREFLFQKYPKVRPLVENQSCAIASFESNRITVYFMAILMFQCVLSIPVSGTLMYLSFKALDEQKDKMSVKTLQMHRQLLKSLIVQMIVPFSTILIPYSILSGLVFWEMEISTAIYKTLFIIGSLHSFTNTLMMLIHIAPYRNELKRIFLRGRVVDGSSMIIWRSSQRRQNSFRNMRFKQGIISRIETSVIPRPPVTNV